MLGFTAYSLIRYPGLPKFAEPDHRAKHINKIDQLLPQTQCTQCDYPRCRDYAAAIADGDADINQCPPGASITIKALSKLTGHPAKALNPQNGIEEPRLLAIINESACIGCKLCIKVCPVDCIVGAGKLMHTVIEGDCTGCKLCVPVCPTDCIELLPAPFPDRKSASLWPAFSTRQVETARHQTEQKIIREKHKLEARKLRRSEQKRAVLKLEIQAVLARKRGKS